MAIRDEPYISNPPFPGLDDLHNNWNPERRRRYAEMMRERKPWTKSTGPKTAAGKARSSRNARKHGLYSREMKLLRTMLTRQRQLHGMAERYIRTKIRAYGPNASNELDKDPVLTVFEAMIAHGREALLRLAPHAIMQKPCILGPPEGKS